MKRILEWIFFIGALAWMLPGLSLTMSGGLVLGLLVFLFKPTPP